MKRLLKSPAVNAACISVFTAFYALVFLMPLKNFAFDGSTYPQADLSFWPVWGRFLASGRQSYIAYALIALTILVVLLLMIPRRAHDEYHTAILLNCLAVAAVLTLAAIAVFCLMLLNDPSGIIEKFTLFIVIHWGTVVLSNLCYALLCRRK